MVDLAALQKCHDYEGLSALFGLPVAIFKGALYGLAGGPHYSRFEIKKRNGGSRVIESPNRTIRKIQRALFPVLVAAYKPNANAHGFIAKRSVVSNVECHIGKATVLSLDLQDFFHSISFRRVRGLFLAPPFRLNWTAANILSQACCCEGRLPAGGITSPVIANLLLSGVDRKLSSLAARFGGHYSRYADDMTLSFDRSLFHLRGVAARDELGNVVLSPQLLGKFSEESFSLNPEKTRVAEHAQRKIVTGIVVNEKRNVPRNWFRELDATVHAISKFGSKSVASKLLPHLAPDVADRVLLRMVHGRLSYLRMIRGTGDWLSADLAYKFNQSSSDARLKIPDVELISRRERAPRALLLLTTSNSTSPPFDEFVDQGSAFVLENGLIVTADHILHGPNVFVRKERAFTSQFPCDVIHRDAHRDIAILRLKEHQPSLIRSRALLGDVVGLGQYIESVGYPGYVMGQHCSRQLHEVTTVRTVAGIQKLSVTGSILGGLSGGPVFDASSRVVGLVHRGASPGGIGNEAISVREIRAVLASL